MLELYVSSLNLCDIQKKKKIEKNFMYLSYINENMKRQKYKTLYYSVEKTLFIVRLILDFWMFIKIEKRYKNLYQHTHSIIY